MEYNYERLKEPYNPAIPIQELFKHVEWAIELVDAANDAYTDMHILGIVYNLLHKTGLFKDPFRNWKKTTNMLKIWVNFKVDFTEASKDFLNNNETEAGSAFGQVNYENIGMQKMERRISQFIYCNKNQYRNWNRDQIKAQE